jgi:peptidyl-prolyl cis-trans isomerase C
VRRVLLGLIVILTVAAVHAEGPVVKVGDVEVAGNELAVARKVLASQLGEGADPRALDRGAYEQVVGRILLAKAAREAGLMLAPGEVEAVLEPQRKQAGGAEQFAKNLAEVGLTEKDIERVMGDTMLAHKYVQEQIASKVVISDADAKKYFDEHPNDFKRNGEVKLWIILVTVKADADDAAKAAAKARADKALERIKAGEDWAKVAAEVSDDPTKSRGGDVGWVQRGLLLREVEDPIFALKPGEMTGVLPSKFGYNLFKVEDTKGPRSQTFEEVKNGLMQFLKGREVDARVKQRVTELKGKTTIVVLDPKLKASIESAPTKIPVGGQQGAKPDTKK